MDAPVTHVLFESSVGYAIFQVKLAEDIAAKSLAVQGSIADLSAFSRMVSLISFSPFKNAAQALDNANDVSEGIVSDHLQNVLELSLSKLAKKSSVLLGVFDSVLAGNIKGVTSIPCIVSEVTSELLRGIRLHATKLLTGLQGDDLNKSQLGLGHAYSRSKLKFNVNRADNMIIQAIALLDQLDKDVNLFGMRIREWYGYHFPELARLVPDNHLYARVAQFLGDKSSLDETRLPDLAELLEDDTTLAKNILDAARGSMGASLAELDTINIAAFATRVVSLAEYRKKLSAYLVEKMNAVAPSLTALLGERIGARLISHAGSLTSLSKYPASTVQILGAEKALFRALKTKGNTPKYGLLYHSSFIGRAGPKFKGRISRFLANKCSIASRIDCYTDNPTSKFGEALRSQVDERLNFFENGVPPSRNADTMERVLRELAGDAEDDTNSDVDAYDGPAITTLDAEPPRKKKKEKGKEKEKEKEKERKKKRKAEEALAMDIDGEPTRAGKLSSPPMKKAKLSKDERIALKKAKKEHSDDSIADADAPPSVVIKGKDYDDGEKKKIKKKEKGEKKNGKEKKAKP